MAFCGSMKADVVLKIEVNDSLSAVQIITSDQIIGSWADSTQVVRPVKFKRGKAIIFTVLTGLLGGHRIYLGTHHRTPIIYSITLGGLGILPLVDLVNLIFTKDISRFEHKSQIIMWGK